VSDSEFAIDVRHLSTAFQLGAVQAIAVNDVSLTVRPGETVSLVGESGCGKSVFAHSLLRLVKPPGKILGGEVWVGGRDLMQLPEPELRQVRGRDVSIIFQEPATSLNPVKRVGQQVAETMLWHRTAEPDAIARRVVELFRLVGIPAPEQRAQNYPHELSGGMQQRVMIAMALACNPKLLIADEPTTALDVTIQAQVLDLLDELKRRLGMGVLLITHDLGVVAQWSDRVAVIYAGRKIEQGPTREVLDHPLHPYTRALLAARPDVADIDAPLREIPGNIPSITAIPPGCAFADRCAVAEAGCRAAVPPLLELAPGHWAACFVAQRGRERHATERAP
jgi:oligopeptide/dipeptide ABC transporter ATP-binding protein